MSADAGTWLATIALAIPLAAAAATAPRALWLLDQRRRHETSGEQARAADREAMLGRVRDKWIDGILTPSFSHTERLTLGILRNGRERTQTPVLQLFLRTGGGMLILGASGGGKTTLLLELADGLLERAESDARLPVPVVASLASWAATRQPLATWLTAELAERYRIPSETARNWAAEDDLVLLLDGLDEVAEPHRDACAAAINEFLEERPLTRMALCCQTDAIRQLTVPLKLVQILEILPVAQDQVDSYLARLETTWTPMPEIRSALAASERLRVPMLLKAAALAHRGRTPAREQAPEDSVRTARGAGRLQLPDWPPEIAEIFAPKPPWGQANGADHAPIDEATIWDAYLARMLSQRAIPAGRGEAATRVHLAWLAARLHDGDDPEFQLDRLGQSGASAPRRSPHQALHQAMHHAASADRWLQTTALDAARWLETRTRGARALGPVASWLRDRARRARPGAWLGRLPRALVRPAEETGWSPERRPPLAAPLTGVLLVPAVIALATALAGPVLAVLAAIAAGLLFGLGLPRRLGRVPRPSQPRTVPNETVRRSARQAAVTGLATTVAVFAGLLLVSLLVSGLTVLVALTAALLAGLAASVSNGSAAWVRHHVERARLVRDSALPWRTVTFLDAMSERGLLHRSGTGYAFIHPMLRDHLTGQSPAPEAPSAAPHHAPANVRARTI